MLDGLHLPNDRVRIPSLFEVPALQQRLDFLLTQPYSVANARVYRNTAAAIAAFNAGLGTTSRTVLVTGEGTLVPDLGRLNGALPGLFDNAAVGGGAVVPGAPSLDMGMPAFTPPTDGSGPGGLNVGLLGMLALGVLALRRRR